MNFSLRILACFMAVILTPPADSSANGRPRHTGEVEHPFDIRNIPTGLRGDASAVIRDKEVTLDVSDRERASETVREVITIFKREGREFGHLELSYDQFRRIKDLYGALLDEQGVEIRTLEGDDIKDESDIAGFELYADDRVKKISLYHDTYPYTVEFTYRITYSGYVAWPTWVAQRSGEPVQLSRYTVIVPQEWPFRYWVNSDSPKPVITVQEDGRKAYIWEARNLPEMSQENLEEEIEKRTTVVHTAPGEFEIDDFRGDMTTWGGFGKWAGTMYTGKDVLPETALKDVRVLIARAHSEREKVDILYRYMQSRTRYVAIELGIGGWQPFDAGFVHEKGYGDCKALSNYMVALLKVAGITAYPALVSAGGTRSRVVEEFPSDEFNHVITCVPGKSDSLWLECTSGLHPSGHLGTFTENRPALLLTPGGGVLVHTPATTARQNRCAWSGHVDLQPTGGGSGSFVTLRTGDQSDEIRFTLQYESAQKQEDLLVGEIEVAGTVLRSHSVEGIASRSDTISVAMQVDMPIFGSRTSNRIFFQPNLTNRSFSPPRDAGGRKSPARLDYPYVDSDSIVYILPTGYVPEALPSAVTLTTPFSRYHTAAIVRGDSAVLYVRTLEMDQAVIPAEEYNQLARFYRDIARADKAQVVLARKE